MQEGIFLLYYKLGTLWHSTEWDKLVAVFSSKFKSVVMIFFFFGSWTHFNVFFPLSLAASDCLLQCVGISGDVLFFGFLIAAFWMFRHPPPSPAPLPRRPHPSSRPCMGRAEQERAHSSCCKGLIWTLHTVQGTHPLPGASHLPGAEKERGERRCRRSQRAS